MSVNAWIGGERVGSEHGMGQRGVAHLGFQRHRSGRSNGVRLCEDTTSGVQSVFHVSAHSRSVGSALSMGGSESDALCCITAGLVFLLDSLDRFGLRAMPASGAAMAQLSAGRLESCRPPV